MRKLVLPLLAAAALAAPALASAAPATGVVLKVDRKAGRIAVADAAGKVSLVHLRAGVAVKVGRRVRLDLRGLRNGTFAASRVRVLGVARTAHVRGYVVAVHARRSFTLAAQGAVLTLHRGSTPAARGHALRTIQARTDGGPAVGSQVDATVTAGADGRLDATQVTEVAPSASVGAIGGTLTALGATSLTVHNDGATVTLAIAPGFDTSAFALGDQVLAYFTKQADGSLGLTALSADADASEADDAETCSGDILGARLLLDDEDSGDDDSEVDD